MLDSELENEKSTVYGVSYRLLKDGAGLIARWTGPDSQRVVYANPFRYFFSKLEWIVVPRTDPVLQAVDGVLLDRRGKTLIAYPACRKDETYRVPDGVTAIGAGAFAGNRFLEKVIIPESLREIGWEAFQGCTRLREFAVTQGNPALQAVDGVLLDKSGGTLIAYPAGRQEVMYRVPDGVKAVGAGAFSGNRFLEAIFVPEGALAVRETAFAGCSGLREIALPDSIWTIGTDAFADCQSLSAIRIPRGMESIGYHAFAWSGLKDVTIPETVKSIDEYAFCHCESLNGVVIPESVEYIEEGAFSGCAGLETVTLPARITANIAELKTWKDLGVRQLPDDAALDSDMGLAIFEGCGKLRARVARGSDAEAYCQLYDIPCEYADE